MEIRKKIFNNKVLAFSEIGVGGGEVVSEVNYVTVMIIFGGNEVGMFNDSKKGETGIVNIQPVDVIGKKFVMKFNNEINSTAI